MYISVGIKIGLSVYVPIFVNYCKFIYIFLICIFGWMVFLLWLWVCLSLSWTRILPQLFDDADAFLFCKTGGAVHCIALRCMLNLVVKVRVGLILWLYHQRGTYIYLKVRCDVRHRLRIYIAQKYHNRSLHRHLLLEQGRWGS